MIVTSHKPETSMDMLLLESPGFPCLPQQTKHSKYQPFRNGEIHLRLLLVLIGSRFSRFVFLRAMLGTLYVARVCSEDCCCACHAWKSPADIRRKKSIRKLKEKSSRTVLWKMEEGEEQSELLTWLLLRWHWIWGLFYLNTLNSKAISVLQNKRTGKTGVCTFSFALPWQMLTKAR